MISTHDKPAAWPGVTVAVTGLLGSGKSTFTGILKSFGLPVIDCDRIAASLTAPGGEATHALARCFGTRIVTSEKGLDRQKMLELVLSDSHCRSRLEAILHPRVFHIMDQMLAGLRNAGNRVAVVEVPLLFEAGWHGMFDLNCMVTAPLAVCLERVRARNGVSMETARRWMALQMSGEAKEALADVVIENSGDLRSLEGRARKIHDRIMGMVNLSLS